MSVSYTSLRKNAGCGLFLTVLWATGLWALLTPAIAQAAACGGSTTSCGTTTTVTYNGASLTLAGAAVNGTVRSELWYLVAPAAGAHNIVVTTSAANVVAATSMSFSGVDQTTPLGSVVSAIGTDTTPSLSVTSAMGEPVYDIVGALGTTAPTQGLQQTLRQTTDTSTGATQLVAGSSTEPGLAVPAAMSWTIPSADWAIAAVPIKASTGLTDVTVESFTATLEPDDVRLNWNAGYEPQSLGFFVYRAGGDGERVQLNEEIIAGDALLGTKSMFSYVDASAGFRGSVAYWLKDVKLDGTFTWHGPVSPLSNSDKMSDNSDGSADASADSSVDPTPLAGAGGCAFIPRTPIGGLIELITVAGLIALGGRRRGGRGQRFVHALIAIFAVHLCLSGVAIGTGGVSVDATASGSGVSGLSFSHTVGGGTNRVLVVGVVIPIVCADVTSDANHCGSCTQACSTQHVSVTSCSASTCNGNCVVGYADCNGNKLSDGCEALGTCASCCGTTCPTGSACVAGACQIATGGTAIYQVPSSTVGLQSYTGPLGMDFNVVSPVIVTQLGVFDSGSNGLSTPITAYIYDRDTQSSIGSMLFAAGNTGTLVGGSRYLTLACPLALPAGFHGSIVADGYSASEPNGNMMSGGTWTTNGASGAISFVNGGRYGGTPGTYPTSLDSGPANRYAAGTFVVATAGGCTTSADCPGFNQATVTCAAGVCGGACNSGYADCNTNLNFDGCEINTNTDTGNCGSCGFACSTNNIFAACSSGVCGGTCTNGFADCNGNPSDGCEGVGACGNCCGAVCGGGQACLNGTCQAVPGTLTVAYNVPAATVGNQSWTGALGMDFDVVSTIVVTQLGVFDSNSDGLMSPITAYIYDRDTQTVVTSLLFAAGATGTLVDGSRFLSLACPLSLPAGFHGEIVADGYGASEMNGNGMGSTPSWTTDTGSGSISFSGVGRYAAAAGVYPTSLDSGPANRYAAGTFQFAH